MNDAKHTKCDCDFIWGYGIGQHEIKGIKYCSLHSAAPDLLAACEARIDEWHADSRNFTRNEPPSLALMRTAIAKAEGR